MTDESSTDNSDKGKSKRKPPIFGNDDLDEAVIAADDTGMLASEKFITEAEIEEGEAGVER